MIEPVLVDTSLHRAFSTLYAIYVATGVVAAGALPPSLEAVGGRELSLFWILGMAAASLFAFWFSLDERWERREMVAAFLVLGLVFTYALAVLINTFWGSEFSVDRLLVGVFSLSYSVFPAWRVQFFFRKYRRPRG